MKGEPGGGRGQAAAVVILRMEGRAGEVLRRHDGMNMEKIADFGRKESTSLPVSYTCNDESPLAPGRAPPRPSAPNGNAIPSRGSSSTRTG